MKILTYNLRYDGNDSDGANHWSNRRGLVIDRLEKEMPDVIGFQEVTPPMNEYMRTHLRYWTLVGCGRGADYQGEHNPVAFRSDKYELIGLDVSWLSETPYVPGSRYEIQSHCPRVITHAILRPIGLGEPFHFYNTHLDHASSEARVQGAERLIEKMQADQLTHPFPLFLTGDFNATPDAPEIELLKTHPFGLTDRSEGVGTTWHNWGKSDGERIDYIFTRGFAADGKPILWNENLNGIYLSDHYPMALNISREDGGNL